ncbi:MAG: hypothetical protein WBQ53_13720 [Methylocystis sp.]
MISKATMKQGESLCRQKQGIPASIKNKCMSYVGINESRLGAFATQMGAAKLFLMWLRSELDHPMDEDRVRRSQKPWISASTSEANKRRH